MIQENSPSRTGSAPSCPELSGTPVIRGFAGMPRHLVFSEAPGKPIEEVGQVKMWKVIEMLE